MTEGKEGGADRATALFSSVGAVHHPGAATSVLDALLRLAAAQTQGRAGVRLHGIAELTALLSGGAIRDVAAHHLGEGARPVRAVLFDKSPAANWSLAWHQDRTIAVQARHDVAGYGPWTRKRGIQHVEPPFAVIEAMVTLRIHLDDVPDDNAPLLIAPGSHRLGRIPEPEIADVVARLGSRTCIAGEGDIWAYATPILHASAAARGARRRRVVQVDYAAGPLAAPLAWLGV